MASVDVRVPLENTEKLSIRGNCQELWLESHACYQLLRKLPSSSKTVVNLARGS